MQRVASILALLVLALPTVVVAQETYDKVLAGIGSVTVLIDVVGEHLPPADVRREVETLLRTAGVPIDGQGQGATGYLYVKVRLHCDPSGLCAYSVDLSLEEDVQVFRNRVGFVHAAITWHSTGVVGYVGLDYVSDILEDVKGEVDMFVDAYLTANAEQ